MPREEAEESQEWIQPIPVGVIRRVQSEEFCILRRVKDTREDLKSKLTLVIGGHVDQVDNSPGFSRLLKETLERELHEEVSLCIDKPPEFVGVAIDSSTVLSSRHIAFVFIVAISQDIVANAPEEFSSKSKYSGQFLTPDELVVLRSRFDPWSTLILEDYIAPKSGVRLTTQPSFPMPTE
jgi:predicted NUDIX family phosphoesterase